MLTGLSKSDAGTFILDGEPYQPTAVHQVARAGIARTFQNIRLFGGMTALENVMVGRHVRTRQGLLGAVLRTPAERREEKEIKEYARALLDYVEIGQYAGYRPVTYRTVTNAGLRSRVHWPPSRNCWPSMNLPRA